MTRCSFIRLCTPATAWTFSLLLTSGCGMLHARHLAASPAARASAVAPVHEAAVRHVAASDPDLMLFGMESTQQVAAPQARPNTSIQQQTFAEVGRDFDPDVDMAGKQIVFASTRHCARPNLYMQAIKGRAVAQLTDDPASEIQPRFSPDASRVAFASDRAGQWDIYVLDLQRRSTIQLTRSEDNELTPSWSPDGKWLAYSRLSSASGVWELWLVSLENDAARCIGQGLLPRFSPDGSQIAFQKSRERDGRLFSIWTVQLREGEPSWPTEVAAEPDAALICPAWSPDGHHIAFCRVPATGLASGAGSVGGATARPGQADIYVVEANGAGRMRLTDGGASFAPCFSSEGRVFFSTDRDGRERIWSLKTAEPAAPAKSDLASTAMGQTHSDEKVTHPGVVSGR